ncbi:MAG: fatty acid desaturase [Candidatus Sericytochromatia bacterium]|nr:fatty acid desaturase [Candidatus Sericytochromatia bacterium]
MATQLQAPIALEGEDLGLALQRVKPNYVAAAVGVVFHLLGAAALTQPFHWHYAAMFAFFYAWVMLSTTLYLHRCLSHHAFELATPVRLFFTVGVGLGLLLDPASWVGLHRYHHAHSDAPADIHSPRVGFFHGYVGWSLRFNFALQRDFRRLAEDIRGDWFHRLLEHPLAFGAVHLTGAAIVYHLTGLGGLLWGFYLPLVLVVHGMMLVNTFCHLPGFGYRNHDTDDQSRNNLWITLYTLGEGWHNNHHAAPRKARCGFGWREPDPVAWIVAGLERVGLARNVVW